MQIIKEIKWAEDLENKLLVGRVEDYELFEIETFDDIITLTDVLAFDITYPATIEEAKKDAKEILNKFINKMIVHVTFTTAKKGIETAFVKFDKVGSYKKVWEIKQPEKKTGKVDKKLSGALVGELSGAKSGFGIVKNVPIFEKTDWKIYDGKIRTESNTKFNTDNWKKQKRDSKGRFIPKKGK